MTEYSVSKQRQKINRSVYGMLVLVVVIFVLILSVFEYQHNNNNRNDELMYSYHFSSSENGLKILSSIDKTKYWFSSLQLVLNKNKSAISNSLSPIDIEFSESDHINLLKYDIERFAKNIKKIQDEYAGFEFEATSNIMEEVEMEVRNDLSKLQLSGSYSILELDRILEPLIIVTYQLQRLHQFSYQEIRLSIDEDRDYKTLQIISLIVALTFIGLFSVIRMLRHVHRSLSALTKAQEKLKASEAALNKAQKIARVGHWKLNSVTSELWGSDELFRIIGLSREEATFRSIKEKIHPDDRDMDIKIIRACIEKGEGWDVEHRLIDDKGDDKWIHAIGEVVTDNQGKVVELLGTVQDVTEQRKAEQEIERSQARFVSMFESMPDAMIYASPERNIVMINNSAIQLFGYSEAELIGCETKILYASQEEFKQQGVKRYNVDAKIATVPYEVAYKNKDGREFQGETLGSVVKSPTGEVLGYLGIIRDVSERTQVDAILRSLASGSAAMRFADFLKEVLERLTDLYDCEYAFIGMLNDDETHVKTLAVRENEKTIENFEYPLEGTPCLDVIKKNKKLISKNASKIYAKDQMISDHNIESYFGAPLVSPDGSVIGVLSVMSCSVMEIDEWTEPVLSVFATRVSLEIERESANQELLLHREHLEELVKRRTSDLIKARDEAERANVSKSEFLSRMSHELRTPMNAILGFGQMLELDAEGFNQTQRDNVNEILDAGHHLLALINEVLDLAKIESGKLEINMERVKINDVLLQCTALIGAQAESLGIEIIDNVSEMNYIVMADSIRLKQILLNLLSNAVKYNKQHGRITLDSEVVGVNRVRISISDRGDGLFEDEINRLFTPFDRLNAVDNVEGAGIGLVITKHLIEALGGDIGVESVVDEGSTFWIELDLSDKENEAV